MIISSNVTCSNNQLLNTEQMWYINVYKQSLIATLWQERCNCLYHVYQKACHTGDEYKYFMFGKCLKYQKIHFNHNNFCIKNMFGSPLPLTVCGQTHVLFTLFMFACAQWCPTNICFVCLRFVYHMLPVSLDCQFLIAPSVFSNVYCSNIQICIYRARVAQ